MALVDNFLEIGDSSELPVLDFKQIEFEKNFKFYVTEDRRKVCNLLLNSIKEGARNLVVTGTPGIGQLLLILFLCILFKSIIKHLSIFI